MINPEYKRLPSEKLIPYARNSRTHSPEQVAQMAASIKEFGFTNPILIDEENGIIAGHGRLLAAQKLGIEEVPVIVMAGLTDAQKRAYVIADNQLALNAGWDIDMLKLEVESLQNVDFDINLLGFDADFFLEAVDEEPELHEEEYCEKFNVIVECANELQQEKIYHKLTEEGYKCQVQSL